LASESFFGWEEEGMEYWMRFSGGRNTVVDGGGRMGLLDGWWSCLPNKMVFVWQMEGLGRRRNNNYGMRHLFYLLK
jgi:hypothetical protein